MREYWIKNGENIRARLEEILTQTDDDGYAIQVEEGRYTVDDTIVIADQRNITIKGCGRVILDGGIIIANEDVKDYNDTIKCVDLKPYGITLGEYGSRGMARNYVNAPNELFVDAQAYSVARYPKQGNITYIDGDIIEPGSNPRHADFSMKCATIRCRDERIRNWGGAKDAYLGGFPIWSWADDRIKIAKIDVENQTITTAEPHLYGFGVTGHSGWHILNLFEELTDPGEYYVDREKQILYFIPEKDCSKSLIQLSTLDKVMIACENSSNITIEGILFENSRSTGIYIEGGECVQVKKCEFRNLGIMAIQIGQGAEPEPHGKTTCHALGRAEGVPVPKPIAREMGSWYSYLYEFSAWDNNGGRNHRVEGCKIYNMGAGGMLLSGGNRKRLEPANNTVYNCEFYGVNRLEKTYKAAVNMMGVGNVVSHCLIHDLPGMAIYMHGNDHLIEFNDIARVAQETSDSGAIYMGRNMSEVGCVFRNNYIHELRNSMATGLGICAIYFDDWDIFNTVYDNFFYDIQGGGFCVIHHTCGGLLSFHNNFIIDCAPGIHMDNKSNAYIYMHKEPLIMTRVHTTDENDMRGVDITSPVYRERYPYLYDVYKNDARPEWMYYNNHMVWHKYDAFVDGEHGDFTQAEWFGKPSHRDEYDWQRRTDVVMGYEDELVPPHRVDFRSIGLVKEDEIMLRYNR
ncbi:MAG: right-handed parallel beta-helix repeat-containing protein [Lachnospiraceae bacterium]|nr:right-handed parallel beta-helix repeat-containing protein [Lachnospiraceae bacterium]